MKTWLRCLGVVLAGVSGWLWAGDAEKGSAERGREALLTRAFGPPIWSGAAYENAWRHWGLSERPANYDEAFRERYGLHPAPYANGGLPMGLRTASGLLGKGITNDCLVCHAGSIAGQSYIGLGNASLDLQGLYDELSAADGRKLPFAFPASNVRGTMEAAAFVIYLMSYRDPNLNLQRPVDLGPRADLCEDVPAWWLLKKKKTMYHDGGVSARSVRSLMQFMLSPLNSAEYIKKQESTFTDIQAYLLSLEPPKYPFAIDTPLAARGKHLFVKTCARCHGTYGPDGKYPNKIIPLEEIGTDSNRANAFSEQFVRHYEKSWFAQERGANGERYYARQEQGYQPPPLDGIWATAPYFHNGSAPTVYHVLNSAARPRIYTRSFRAKKEDYDPVKLGWKITVLEKGALPTLPGRERRKIYDTTQPGRGNGGHPFGDQLTEEERMAVIEYLKTL